jgi:hypothetical protein
MPERLCFAQDAEADQLLAENPFALLAGMRSKVWKLPARYDYPPDHEDKAVELLPQQAELFATSEVSGDTASRWDVAYPPSRPGPGSRSPV